MKCPQECVTDDFRWNPLSLAVPDRPCVREPKQKHYLADMLRQNQLVFVYIENGNTLMRSVFLLIFHGHYKQMAHVKFEKIFPIRIYLYLFYIFM